VGNLAYLIEQDIATVDDKTLKQLLGCCYDQNKHGRQIVDGFLNAPESGYREMGRYIQEDMKNNEIAIGIIKNLLGI
jgi:hypothetical protein